jgi:hypothetical protein
VSDVRPVIRSNLRAVIRGGRDRRRLARAQARSVDQPRRGPVAIRLWLPLTPLFALLAPFALVASPLIGVWRPMRGVSPIRAALTIGAVLMSLSGTVVSVDTRDAIIRIRIF